MGGNGGNDIGQVVEPPQEPVVSGSYSLHCGAGLEEDEQM